MRIINHIKSYLLRNKLFKEFFWALLSKFFAAGMGFFLFIILPRMLGPTDYGIFSLTLSILVFFMLFADFGISASSSKFIAQYIRKDSSQIRNILNDVLLLRFFALAIVSVIGYFSINIITEMFEMPVLSEILLVGVFLVMFWTLTEHFKKLFQGFHRLKFNFCITLVEFGFKIVLSLLLILYYGLLGALFAFLTAYMLSTVVGLFFAYKYFHSEFKVASSAKSFKKDLLGYALPMIFISASFYVFTEIDIIFLGFFTTPAEVGYYSVGKQMARYLPVFAAGIGVALGPMYAHITKENVRELKRTYYKTLRTISYIYFIISVLLFIFAKEVIILLYGTDYILSITILRILLLFMFFFAISSVVSQVIDYTGLAKKRAIALVIAVLLNISLNLLLIPIYGGEGAAMATVASYVPYVLFNLFLCQKHLRFYSQSDILGQ